MRTRGDPVQGGTTGKCGDTTRQRSDGKSHGKLTNSGRRRKIIENNDDDDIDDAEDDDDEGLFTDSDDIDDEALTNPSFNPRSKSEVDNDDASRSSSSNNNSSDSSDDDDDEGDENEIDNDDDISHLQRTSALSIHDDNDDADNADGTDDDAEEEVPTKPPLKERRARGGKGAKRKKAREQKKKPTNETKRAAVKGSGKAKPHAAARSAGKVAKYKKGTGRTAGNSVERDPNAKKRAAETSAEKAKREKATRRKQRRVPENIDTESAAEISASTEASAASKSASNQRRAAKLSAFEKKNKKATNASDTTKVPRKDSPGKNKNNTNNPVILDSDTVNTDPDSKRNRNRTNNARYDKRNKDEMQEETSPHIDSRKLQKRQKVPHTNPQNQSALRYRELMGNNLITDKVLKKWKSGNDEKSHPVTTSLPWSVHKAAAQCAVDFMANTVAAQKHKDTIERWNANPEYRPKSCEYNFKLGTSHKNHQEIDRVQELAIQNLRSEANEMAERHNNERSAKVKEYEETLLSNQKRHRLRAFCKQLFNILSLTITHNKSVDKGIRESLMKNTVFSEVDIVAHAINDFFTVEDSTIEKKVLEAFEFDDHPQIVKEVLTNLFVEMKAKPTNAVSNPPKFMLNTTSTRTTYTGCYYVLGLVAPACSVEMIATFEEAINEQNAIESVSAMERVQHSRDRTDQLVKKLDSEADTGFTKTILTIIKRELHTHEFKSFSKINKSCIKANSKIRTVTKKADKCMDDMKLAHDVQLSSLEETINKQAEKAKAQEEKAIAQEEKANAQDAKLDKLMIAMEHIVAATAANAATAAPIINNTAPATTASATPAAAPTIPATAPYVAPLVAPPAVTHVAPLVAPFVAPPAAPLVAQPPAPSIAPLVAPLVAPPIAPLVAPSVTQNTAAPATVAQAATTNTTTTHSPALAAAPIPSAGLPPTQQHLAIHQHVAAISAATEATAASNEKNSPGASEGSHEVSKNHTIPPIQFLSFTPKSLKLTCPTHNKSKVLQRYRSTTPSGRRRKIQSQPPPNGNTEKTTSIGRKTKTVEFRKGRNAKPTKQVSLGINQLRECRTKPPNEYNNSEQSKKETKSVGNSSSNQRATEKRSNHQIKGEGTKGIQHLPLPNTTKKSVPRAKLKSRRAQQRTKYKKRNEKDRETNKLINSMSEFIQSESNIQIANHTNRELNKIRRDLGHVADPNKTPYKNATDIIGNTPISKLDNSTFHNLCTKLSPPHGIEDLLGLGLKFCIENEKPTQDTSHGITKIGNSLQVAWNLSLPKKQNEESNDRIYNPKIYIPSGWVPDITSNEINERLLDFDTELKNLIDKNNKDKKFHYNLCTRQRALITMLKNHPDFLICQTDKNLGVCIIERLVYIDRALSDHLLKKETYTQLTRVEFDKCRQQATADIKKHIKKLKKHIPAHEYTYLHRAYFSDNQTDKRIPQFYITPKIHKTPWATRPVVSDSGSLTSYLSKWLDVQLNKLVKAHVKTLLQDSEDLRRQLQKLSPLPRAAYLFTSDADSMYTSIDPDHAIAKLRKWLQTLPEKSEQPFHTEHLLTALTLVMKNNLFAFGDTYWKQISGVAMGTPTACMLATIYYGIHENTHLIPKYKRNIPFLKRFIDDMIGVFLVYDDSDLEKWKEFQNDLPYGKLTWGTEKLTRHVDFLDLTITVADNGIITTRTFQKKMNLYLYIPPHSAHSKKLFSSIIYSTLRRYWLQNSEWKDFKHISGLFYRRLIARGHKRYTLTPEFKKSLDLINEQTPFEDTDNMEPPSKNKKQTEENKDSESKTIFFHMEYHPKGITNHAIQSAFKNTFNNEKTFERRSLTGKKETYTSPGLEEGIPGISRGIKMRVDRLIIALSKPKNLRDHLNPSTLHLPDQTSVANIVKNK